jgi:hypothetical protein
MMRRSLLAALALLGLVSKASATTIATLAVTTAQTAAVTTPVQFPLGTTGAVVIQCNFTYGSGGTSATAWVQSSIDAGVTWVDMANCSFTTSSARFIYNLSSLTPVTTEYTATDGTLASNTAHDGIIGPFLRVKYTTVGTYAGSTKLNVDIAYNGPPAHP